MRTATSLAAVVLLLAAAVVARADSFADGRALYKAGDFAGAAVKLEQAAREQPSNAKIWWQLNFAYNKLGRHADALKAVQKAGTLDPSHAFASDPAKYQQILGQRQAKAGGVPAGRPPFTARSGRSAAGGSGADGITSQLLSGDVYVQPGMNVDVGRLRRVADELRPRATVKFVVFNSDSGSSRLASEADRIRRYLNLGKGYVIASSRRGVAAAGTSVNRNTLRRLTQEVAPTMEAGDYTGALERLARGLVGTASAQAAGTRRNWLIVLGVVVGAIVVWVAVRSARNARAMAERREPIERLKSEVISQMNFLDENIPLVEDRAAAGQVRQARVAAGTKLDEAVRVMRAARSERDLMRAQSLLDQAQGDIQQGRLALDRAMSGTPAPAGAAAAAASAAGAAGSAPVTGTTTDWNQVPEAERGVCFFCSRPSLMSELTPVTVNLDGQAQKVLACATDLATIKTGQMPNIRAFQQDGRYVPWYADRDYDPYRDYNARGYGTGDFMRDMITFSLIDRMFWNWHQPMGWGWGGWGGGYAFYPEHEYYRDYYSDRAAGAGDFDRTQDAAGTDFLGSTGGDLDSSSAGSDFGSVQS